MKTSFRLDKYLADMSVGTRSEVKNLIKKGLVTVNGEVIRKPEYKVDIEKDDLVCRGEPVVYQTLVYYMLNKPAGVISATNDPKQQTVLDLITDKSRKDLFPVGRLDKDSEGLLLLTNQGELVNKIMRAGNFHEKEYLVTTDRPVSDEMLKGMASGVPILDTITRPCTVTRTGKCSFRIILTQGLNRQIRRMCEYYGCQVKTLKRIRIMNLKLDRIEKGKYREATKEEWDKLLKLLENSRSNPVVTGKYHKPQTGGSYGHSRK